MSNAIRYDSLLVRHLAEELDERLAGRRVRAIAFRRAARSVHLRLDDTTIVWDLDPARGGISRAPPSRERGNVAVPKGTRVARVTAPPDERIIEIELDGAADGGARTLIVELVTNRWNAWALGADRRILAVLRAGASATRSQLPGDVYRPPRQSLRLGAREPVTLDEWLRLLLPSPPRERRRRILESLAYTSPINVGMILGEAGESADAQALRDAHARYVRVVRGDDRAACLIEPERAAQPYCIPVAPDVRPEPGLLEAFEAAATRAGHDPPAAAPGERTADAIDRLEERLNRIDRRTQRLRAELDGAPDEAASRRRLADLLMSQLHRLRRGEAFIDLEDFEGSRIRIELDPALAPAENANALYEQARKRDRAAERLPQLLARALAERDAVLALLQRVRAGEATDDDVEAILRSPRDAARRQAGQPPALPYRRYRTSGGLEVRVGRGSAANDALTFRNSSPSDIWLHARDVAGAHVILRWSDREANPPARDLRQAAVLAALHSRARTSATVPVDWTRRKYVRKPRKAPPGRVVIERAKTLFVEPDAALDERLRWDPLEDVVDGS